MEEDREELVARKQRIHDAVQESTRSDEDLGEAVYYALTEDWEEVD